MADGTHIEWTDATWNPIRARLLANPARIGWHCEHVSPGCAGCYAEKLNVAGRSTFTGTRLPYKPGHRKNIEIFLDEKKLLEPLRWRRSRAIFPCSMTDLFADFVPDAMIAEVFGVMAVAGQQFFGPGGIGMRAGTIWEKGRTNPRPIRAWSTKFGPHRFQVLTKRSSRMRALLTSPGFRKMVAAAAYRHAHDRVCAGGLADGIEGGAEWPLPNVWLGVSIEDRPRMLERAAELKRCPAAVHFWSGEPLLGDLGEIPPALLPDWVICGGESGPKARPMHPDWARSLRDQCAAAGVPFFFKQWGAWVALGQSYLGAAAPRAFPIHRFGDDGPSSGRVGKKLAGRLLDGVEHDGMPAQAERAAA